MPAVGRSTGKSEERPRAQDDPLGATVDATRETEVCNSTSFLFRIVQLCQARQRSSAREPVLRRECALKKVDKLASTVKLLADRSFWDRSRSPRSSKKTIPKVQNRREKEKKREKTTPFDELVRQHKSKFTLQRGD